ALDSTPNRSVAASVLRPERGRIPNQGLLSPVSSPRPAVDRGTVPVGPPTRTGPAARAAVYPERKCPPDGPAVAARTGPPARRARLPDRQRPPPAPRLLQRRPRRERQPQPRLAVRHRHVQHRHDRRMHETRRPPRLQHRLVEPPAGGAQPPHHHVTVLHLVEGQQQLTPAEGVQQPIAPRELAGLSHRPAHHRYASRRAVYPVRQATPHARRATWPTASPSPCRSRRPAAGGRRLPAPRSSRAGWPASPARPPRPAATAPARATGRRRARPAAAPPRSARTPTPATWTAADAWPRTPPSPPERARSPCPGTSRPGRAPTAIRPGPPPTGADRTHEAPAGRSRRPAGAARAARRPAPRPPATRRPGWPRPAARRPSAPDGCRRRPARR